MLNVYLIVSTIAFSSLAFVWTKDSWLDVFCKFLVTTLTGIGIFLLLEINGYIIKTPEVKQEVKQECSINFVGEKVCKELK